MLKLLFQLLAATPKVRFMAPKQKPPASLAELRPNTGAVPVIWAVSHQSPFPWLNTVAFLPTIPTHGNGPDQLAGPVLETI